jgi:RNA-binding protein 25
MAYRERLKAWEARESKKRHEYSADKKKEKQRKKLLNKELKKLKQFLEDYDDSKDDSTHFKGIILEKKMRQRERDLEMDQKDRQREKEELDELKRKLIEKGIEDVENEIKRIQSDENTKMKQRLEKLDQSSSSEDEKEEEIMTQETPIIINGAENHVENGSESNNNINEDSNQGLHTLIIIEFYISELLFKLPIFINFILI